MKLLAVAFAGACSLLLACAKHDDTTFPNVPHPTFPPPTDATFPNLPQPTFGPPTHPVLDAGLIVFPDADGEGVPDIGGGETHTPDAAEVVDVAHDAATPDLGGLGSTCDVFADSPCKPPNQCYPNPSTGNGICGQRDDLPITSSCNPTNQNCAPHLFCGTGSCTNLCHLDNPQCSAGTVCTELRQFVINGNNVGYCSN